MTYIKVTQIAEFINYTLGQGFPTRGARTIWWCEAAFQGVRDGFSILFDK